MRFRFFSLAAGFAALSLLTASLLVGCESADGHVIDVTPSTATLSASSPTVRLTASGWDDFSWTLSDTGIGTLSSHNGRSVVYRATSFSSGESSSLTQTINVVAVGTSTSSSSTNTTSTSSTSSSYSATVTIHQ